MFPRENEAKKIYATNNYQNKVAMHILMGPKSEHNMYNSIIFCIPTFHSNLTCSKTECLSSKIFQVQILKFLSESHPVRISYNYVLRFNNIVVGLVQL